MAAESGRRVGVIGAGSVGRCTALWLQRDRHRVFLVEPGTPGEGASFGNAGCFNGSSVTPAGMPGVVKQVPRWLMDPLGPLALRWSYLPQILPYLVRFVRSATPEKVRAQARAMRPLVGPTVPLVRELAKMAGADTLVHQRGHLYVYRSAEALAKDGLAWALRRQNGVEVDQFDADELRQLEPALSREYVRGLLVRENGHTSNPFGLVSALVENFRRHGGEIVRAGALGSRLEGRAFGATRRGARLRLDGSPPVLARLAAGARTVADEPRRDLRLRPWPCRDDRSADDRQDCCRSRRRPPGADRHHAVRAGPVWRHLAA